MGYYHRWEEFPEREVSYLQEMPESSKLLIRINAKKGARVPNHHHEAEQIFLLFKGKMRVTSANESPRELSQGDIWVLPSNCPHSVEYIEDTDALEIVSPIRLDNFIGYTVKHTFFEDE